MCEAVHPCSDAAPHNGNVVACRNNTRCLASIPSVPRFAVSVRTTSANHLLMEITRWTSTVCSDELTKQRARSRIAEQQTRRRRVTHAPPRGLMSCLDDRMILDLLH